MDVRYAVRSKTGLKRNKNEDSYRIDQRDMNYLGLEESSVLLAVADGLGGHPCGEVASRMACVALAGILDKLGGSSVKDLQSDLVQRFFDIDDHIRQHTQIKRNCSEMGTTLSVIVVFGQQAVIAHIGDTRIYCLRDGGLKLLTTDHTIVHEMFEKGVLTAEMVERSLRRNVLTQVVGTDEQIEDVYTHVVDILSGDRILLSSDGLHDTISFQDIEKIMKEGDVPEETAEQLLSRAIVKGGEDDITMIVAHLS